MKKLLPWQEECLNQFKNEINSDFVLIAGTGTGKTTAGAAMAQHAFSVNTGGKRPLIIVACPYRSIKDGWKETFEGLGFFVASKPKEIAEDRSVIVTTYAGAESILSYLSKEIASRDVIVIFDEFHHLEEHGSWAEPFISGDYKFKRRIFLSGTPWRETGEFNVNLVPYDQETDEVKADYTHSYGENVNLLYSEGKNTVAVRFIPHEMDVEIETFDEHGGSLGVKTLSTEDTVRSDSIAPFVRFESFLALARRPVVTKMIDDAVYELERMRKSGAMPDAGGIIFVSGKQEGNAVKQYLADRHGKCAVFVQSDDPIAHNAIKTFRKSNDEWIIAIDMIAEGTDIPRLNVAVDLSFKLTLMHIIQRWGRVLRVLRKGDGSLDKNIEAAVFFINHAQLRYVAEKIEDDVKRNKRKDKGGGGDEPPLKRSFKPVAETGRSIETIFKGKTVDESRYDLACWLVAVNYGGKFQTLGHQVALEMAEVFMTTDTIPPEYFEEKPRQPSQPAQPSKADEFDDAVERYKRKTGQIAYEFFGGDFSSAAKAVNIKMGTQRFSRDNATLEQVKARAAAAEAVYNRLCAERDEEAA